MNVAGYVRVSSEGQIENYSIPQQKEIITKYCEIKGWNLIKLYIDAGFTGFNTNRPELQEMINDIDLYDIVLVFKMDRLSRRQKDMLELVELFNDKGVKFVSVQENFDTSTPIGFAMLGILSSFAQLERETIKERMKLGRVGRAKKGLWRAGSNVPTGYSYIDGHLVIREDEAIQIRKIFELFLAGWSIHKIKEYMHENYTNRYSSWAQASAVSTVLRNKLYIGMLPSKTDGIDYPGEHEAIIDKDTFDKVQKLLSARAENFDPVLKHPFKARYLLTGITYCGECGGRVSCVVGHGYGYYGCHKKHDGDPRNKKKKRCSTPNYNVKILDQLIIDEVMKLAYDEKAIQAQIKPRKKKDHRKAIRTLKSQKSRLIDLYALGGIDLAEIQIKIADIDNKINMLREDVPQDPELSFEEAKKIFDNIGDLFAQEGNTEQKRAVLQSLIKRIELNGNEINIYWRFA